MSSISHVSPKARRGFFFLSLLINEAEIIPFEKKSAKMLKIVQHFVNKKAALPSSLFTFDLNY